MRTIKPGRLGLAEKGQAKKRSQTSQYEREVWDDYSATRKGKKKREYEPDESGRLVQKRAVKEERSGNESREELANVETIVVRQDYKALEDQLGYEFTDRVQLKTALTHRSVLGYQERSDYERLEFLGDAVLDLTVAHLLSDRHPAAREGDLSKMRAALVNTVALAEVATRLDIGPFIRLGKGELASGGAERPSILADVMEAIVGAIYLDSDYSTVFTVIESILGTALDVVTPSDPKTELQEALHAAGSEPPTYLVELVEGPEHAPTFVIVVIVDGQIMGRGKGQTKKAAQQEAAAKALAKLTPDIKPVELLEGQDVIFVPGLLVELETPIGGQLVGD